jgi:hypothetical protein
MAIYRAGPSLFWTKNRYDVYSLSRRNRLSITDGRFRDAVKFNAEMQGNAPQRSYYAQMTMTTMMYATQCNSIRNEWQTMTATE